jgi:glycosyltransferase involved in cell wall biosynthesis
VISRYLRDFLTRVYLMPVSRIHVHYRWREVSTIREKAARSERLPGSGPVFGCVARLDWMKDYDTVIRAFAVVNARLGGARLSIVGDGDERERLERLVVQVGVQGAVEFVGHSRDVPSLLARMDIFVFATSETEGFGTVLAEAMAAGVPIIAPVVGLAPEILDDGSVGVLVPPRDIGAMADAMIALWEDHERRAQLSARHFAAWLGLVPRQQSTGGKPRLGAISKRGDGYLRRLLVHGAQAVLRWHRARPDGRRPWLDHLLLRRPVNVAAVAIAHKNARTIWALLVRGERFTGYRLGTVAASN